VLTYPDQPCIGIARLKRWKRAHRLDLNPPTEVLAVLLKEMENKDNKDKVGLQRSHVDELLNTKTEADM
jgi:DNA polymerase delta subunit 4